MTPGDTFTLELCVGNTALETFEDVAALIHKAADGVGAGQECGTVRDDNGNAVGRWGFKS